MIGIGTSIQLHLNDDLSMELDVGDIYEKVTFVKTAQGAFEELVVLQNKHSDHPYIYF